MIWNASSLFHSHFFSLSVSLSISAQPVVAVERPVQLRSQCVSTRGSSSWLMCRLIGSGVFSWFCPDLASKFIVWMTAWQVDWRVCTLAICDLSVCNGYFGNITWVRVYVCEEVAAWKWTEYLSSDRMTHTHCIIQTHGTLKTLRLTWIAIFLGGGLAMSGLTNITTKDSTCNCPFVLILSAIDNQSDPSSHTTLSGTMQ